MNAASGAGFADQPELFFDRFLAPTVEITITSSSQSVLVTSMRVFGSSMTGGADGLYLAICYQSTGEDQTIWEGSSALTNLKVTQNTRVTLGHTAVLSGLPAGGYRFGLCGAVAANINKWNFNGEGTTTAIVF